MQCPKCQTSNPENAKFCIECANPLEIKCPQCGATNPARAKFCMECAHGLKDQAETPPENQLEPKNEAFVPETAESKDSNQFTGKSRLIEEFRISLESDNIQWLQGQAYGYAQNMPYFPLIDLLSRALQIEEGDPPTEVRRKLESGIDALTGDRKDIAPYIGSLYALDYPELSENSPEFWKTNLQNAIRTVLANLARTGPTIVCLEDLQWSDPSTLELLRFLLSDIDIPALFICTYRLPFSIFTGHQLSGIGMSYQEIDLKDLSASEAQIMVQSMLQTENIPAALQKFIQYKLGDIKEFSSLFDSHRDMAESLEDEKRLGMFYVWLGIAHLMSGRTQKSYDYLIKAKLLGKKSGNPKIVGYACTWLSWNCAELGHYEEGLRHGECAQQIAKDFPADQYLFFKSLAGMAYVYTFMGRPQMALECGKMLLEYGKQFSNSRSNVMGYFAMSLGYSTAGDFEACINSSRKAIEILEEFRAEQYLQKAREVLISLNV